MSIMYPYWTLLLAVLFPYVWAFTATAFKWKQMGKVDLNHPRKQNDALEGAGYRASCAQSNAWEALIVYATCFLAAVSTDVPAEEISLYATIWVLFRIAHGVTYVVNVAPLRVAAFAGGLACSIIILLKAL